MSVCGDFGGFTNKGEPCSRSVSSGRCWQHDEYSDSLMPRAPEYFGEQATWFWHKMGSQLQREGYLKKIDYPLLEQAAECYELARESFKAVKKDGTTSRDASNGGRKRNPDMLNYKQMADKFVQIANKLGMSPNTRSQMSVPSDDEQSKDPMEEIVRG